MTKYEDIAQQLESIGISNEVLVLNAAGCIRELESTCRVLAEECAAWRRVDSEHRDNNPCPDLCLRKDYLDAARRRANDTGNSPVAAQLIKEAK